MTEIAELREALAFAIKERNEFWQERDELLAVLKEIEPELYMGSTIAKRARTVIAKVEAK